MKTILLIILANCCILMGAFAANDYVPGHLIIGFKKEVKHISPARGSITFHIESLDALNAQYGCKTIKTIMPAKKGYGGVYVLTFAENADITLLIKAYMGTGMLRYAEPDYIATLNGSIPNDTLFNQQWALNNDGSFSKATATAGADIDMLRAWDIEDGDTAVIMGVIDSGLKMDNPEFAGRFWTNANEIPGNGIDDDNNGYIDDINGWNTTTDTNYLADDHGHGTHVTGIIAANGNNTAGYAGIDRHCKLMICKAADAAGQVDYSWLAEAMYYAIENGAHILNISAGGYWGSAAFTDIATYAYDHNVTIVAAMGNNHTVTPLYPAACAHVIAVGATGPTDKVASFSNFGTHISVVAPGEFIYSASHLYDTAFGILYSGTSQATPHVAGVAALLLAQDKTRKPDDIRRLIETNAEDMVGDSQDEPGWDKYYGYGRLNAYRALSNEALAIKKQTPPTNIPYLYPNPANHVVYLTLATAGNVYITGMNGAIVLQQYLSPGKCAIPLPHIAAGNYLLHYKGPKDEWVEPLTINKQ
jgi:thermitase